MAWTQEGLDRLEAAIETGAMQVQYEDRKVTYRNLDEMMRTRETARRELGQVKRPPHRTVFSTGKGIY